MQETYREAAATVERLQKMLDELVVRGLMACGPAELSTLSSYRDELEKMGASHLASTLDEVHQAASEGQRGTRKLIRAQASLRLFERLLTLRSVAVQYEAAIAGREA